MTERSSVLKELVQYSSENILSHINLTRKSTASFDNCHETNSLIQIEALVSNFCGWEVGTGQKIIDFMRQNFNDFL